MHQDDVDPVYNYVDQTEERVHYYNNINNFDATQDMLNLFAQIEASLKTEFEGKQLACISKLVFYCGVRAKEIPELRIRDVIRKRRGNHQQDKVQGWS